MAEDKLGSFSEDPELFFFFFLAVTGRAAVYNCVIGCLDTFSKLFFFPKC